METLQPALPFAFSSPTSISHLNTQFSNSSNLHNYLPLGAQIRTEKGENWKLLGTKRKQPLETVESVSC